MPTKENKVVEILGKKFEVVKTDMVAVMAVISILDIVSQKL